MKKKSPRCTNDIRVMVVLVALFVNQLVIAQTPKEVLKGLETQLNEIEKSREVLLSSMNEQKWFIYNEELKSYGLPSSNYLEHKSYYFEYSEEHEQSKWVAHMIAPEVEGLGARRTNDFREDPLVLTGTAQQKDYFNYYPDRLKVDQYEGFGYDRGHLAPSADFRWSSDAVSESYYYSNMSPQHPDLNQKKWADLESFLRGYVIRNNVALAIITAPILTDDLLKIKQSPNGLSIPEYYIKIAYDHTNQRAIGFKMANKEQEEPLENYVLTINEIEELTGYDYFSQIDQSLKAVVDTEVWLSEIDKGSVKPIKQNTLPIGHYNTLAAASQMNKYTEVVVCGKVVSARNSRNGHAWINLDRKYPNDYFSVMINKDQLINFTYDPVIHLKDKEICVKGEVSRFGNKPVMKLKIEDSIQVKM